MASPKVPPKAMTSFMELRNRCPNNQKHHLQKLFTKQRQYQDKLSSLEEGLPRIDWKYYKRNVRTEAVSLVEKFEKKYTSLTIPRPEDKYTPRITELKAEVQKDVDEFIKKSNERIKAYEEEIARIQALIPYQQMTWEDFCILCPDKAPDFINRPTFWPHNEEDQIGYEDQYKPPHEPEPKDKKREPDKKSAKK